MKKRIIGWSFGTIANSDAVLDCYTGAELLRGVDFSRNFAIIFFRLMWSRSIAVSTSGFHPDNAGSTPAEITISQSEPESGSFLLSITEKSGLKSSVPKIFSLISKCRPFGNSIFWNACLVSRSASFQSLAGFVIKLHT